MGQMSWSEVALSGCEDAYRLTRNPWKTACSVASSPRQHCCGPGCRGFESPRSHPRSPLAHPTENAGQKAKAAIAAGPFSMIIVRAWERIFAFPQFTAAIPGSRSLRPTLRGQPELLTGRSVKDPGAAGTLSPGPRICRIDRPPFADCAPAATGRPSPELNGGTDVADHGAVTLHTDRDAPSVFAGFRSRPTAKRHSGPRPCHRGRSSRGYLLRRVRAAARCRIRRGTGSGPCHAVLSG